MISNPFFPDSYVYSAYDIDYRGLFDRGVRGVIFDIDNTLVPHDAPADKRAAGLFAKIHLIGLKAMLLSNNEEPRVREFAKDVKYTGYIYKAGKPSKAGYIRAMEEMGTERASTVFIGDQIFTDIAGARNAGIESILVHFVDRREKPHIKLKRILEKPVLFLYFRIHGGSYRRRNQGKR